MSISLRFLGHSAWHIAVGEFDILIDPFITGNPKAPVSADDLNATHIVVTHGHGDHIGDTIGIAKRTNALVISSFEIANYISAKGHSNVLGMSTGGGHDFPFGRITLTIAFHGSALPDGSYGGPPSGVVLSFNGTNIYHAGDTALFSDMKLIAERYPLDIAILPIGDTYTMDITDAVRALDFLTPSVAIPMHYNTFPPIVADAELFRVQAAERGHTVEIMEPGDIRTV